MSQSKKKEKTPDMVNHPPHYTKGGIECINALEAMSTPEEFRGFLRLNSVKYLWRARNKGKESGDYQKSMWYLVKLQEFITKQEGKVK